LPSPECPIYAAGLICSPKVPSTLYATTRFFSTCSEKKLF
jgi:hypothetical protein